MAAQPPPPSAAARRPAPPAPPSHASYILSQVRSGLAHLLAAKALDRETFGKVDDLLSKAVLQQHDDAGRPERGSGMGETEEERLGKRNAWLRETLRETSLLPTIVETAMSIAIPSAIMGDTQREAAVQLVERSQKSIADAITNPNAQRSVQGGAWSGAKGAHVGIRRGLHAAGQGMQELSQKRQEARQRAEEKKAEKREKKAMKRELKAEREAVVRQRQAELLNSSDAETSQRSAANALMTATKDPSSKSLSSPNSHDDSESDNDTNTDDDDDDELLEDVHSQEGAVASVTCGRVDSEDGYTMATTTFSPWPGLLLSSTIVAISDDDVPSAKSIERIRFEQSAALPQQNSQPPPRRVAPPPARTNMSMEAGTPSQSMTRQAATPSEKSTPATGSAHSLSHLPSPATSTAPPPLSRYAQPLPPPHAPQPASESVRSNVAVSSPQQPPQHKPFASSQSFVHQAPPPPSLPPSQGPSSASHSQAPQRTEVRDVTDSKQKSWSRKFGL